MDLAIVQQKAAVALFHKTTCLHLYLTTVLLKWTIKLNLRQKWQRRVTNVWLWFAQSARSQAQTSEHYLKRIKKGVHFYQAKNGVHI